MGCALMVSGFLYEIIWGFARKDDITSALVFWPGYFVAFTAGALAVLHG